MTNSFECWVMALMALDVAHAQPVHAHHPLRRQRRGRVRPRQEIHTPKAGNRAVPRWRATSPNRWVSSQEPGTGNPPATLPPHGRPTQAALLDPRPARPGNRRPAEPGAHHQKTAARLIPIGHQCFRTGAQSIQRPYQWILCITPISPRHDLPNRDNLQRHRQSPR
jgi:hypothetical protein